MPISSSINLGAKLVLTRCGGLMASSDFDHYMAEVWSHNDYFGFNELFYTGEGNWSGFEFNQVLDVAAKSARLIRFKPNSKFAFVVSIGIQEELCKFYTAAKSLKQGQFREIRLFTTEIEAMDWLQGATLIE